MKQLSPHIAKLFTSQLCARKFSSSYCYAQYGKSEWHKAQSGLGEMSSAESLYVSKIFGSSSHNILQKIMVIFRELRKEGCHDEIKFLHWL